MSCIKWSKVKDGIRTNMQNFPTIATHLHLGPILYCHQGFNNTTMFFISAFNFKI